MNEKIKAFIESSGYKDYYEYDIPEIWHFGDNIADLLECAAKTVRNLSPRKLSEIKDVKLNFLQGSMKYNLILYFEGEHDPELCLECKSEKII